MPTGVYKRNPLLRPQTFRDCEHCGKQFGPLPRLSQRFCSYKCKVAAQTTGRKTFRKTSTKARSAQSLLRYHVQAGNITKPDHCEECGKTNCAIEGAHRDYSRPLDVRWLCISCHRKWDRKEPKGATVIVKAEVTHLEAPPADSAAEASGSGDAVLGGESS